MQAVTTIGLDIAKSVFQIHGVDAAGHVIVRRQLKRRYVLAFFQKLPPCLIGMEPCVGAHPPLLHDEQPRASAGSSEKGCAASTVAWDSQNSDGR